jgi:hypothetical protein
MDIIEKMQQQMAAFANNDPYKDIDISEWYAIRDLYESQAGEILNKVQDKTYNCYVRDLVYKLRLSARANKDVTASIYGGILEGIVYASIKRLGSEAQNRIEKWEKDNPSDKPLT